MSLADARAAFDELTRQWVLERRFAVLVRARGGGPPAMPQELREVFGPFEARLCTFPELEPLLAFADQVLVLSDGLVFEVVLQRLVLDGAALVERLPLEKLVEQAAWFTQLTGAVGRNRMPVVFRVVEFHQGPPSPAWLAANRDYVRRGVASPKVSVSVTALDASTGWAWSNGHGLVKVGLRRLVQRAFRERAMAVERRRVLLARSGFQAPQALLGGGLGAALAVGATALMLDQLVRSGQLYAGAALIASAVGAVTSLKLCRVCRRTMEQSAAGGSLAFLGAVAGWWFFGLPLEPATAVLAAMAVFFSLTVGFVADPRRR